jgi:hypothetical protein
MKVFKNSKIMLNTCKSIVIFTSYLKQFVKIVLISFTILCFSGQNNLFGQVGAMNFYKVSKSGKDKLNITNRERALLRIAYYEKSNNDFYEKFWEKQKFTSPRDMYLKIVESSLHEDGLVIVFDVSPKVVKADTGFTIHRRIAKMLSQHLNSKLANDSTNTWIQWMIGVNKNYGPQPKKDSLKSNLFKAAFFYIEPKGGDIALMDEAKGKARGKKRITTREYALIFLKPMLEDILPQYKAFLQFNAVQLYENADLIMEPNKFDTDVISIVYKIDEKTRINDPGFAQLRDLTNRLIPFIENKIKPIKNDWLKIRIEVEPIESPRDRTVLGETKLELPTDSLMIQATPEIKTN